MENPRLTVSGKVNKPVAVLLIDSDELVRAGLERLVRECLAGAEVTVGDCSQDILALVTNTQPDIAIIDYNLGGASGMESVRQLIGHDASLKIILFIKTDAYMFVPHLIKFGVKGILSKNSSVAELSEAMQKVLAGEQFIASVLAKKLAFAAMNNENASPFDQLSPRELEIIVMMLEGKRNQEIAVSLYISDKTVSTYRTRALNKLAVGNTTDLARLAMRHGLIETH
ncbi:MAG TPA: hypothetical protein DD979_02010 [Gammaproteobacteria bacterium]|jgi:two-component system invasion response regulator UvrY|nr:hypothetical protein [Gammaproteobacteria bacterium]